MIVIKILVEYNLCVVGVDGQLSAVQLALRTGHPRVVSLLVESGAAALEPTEAARERGRGLSTALRRNDADFPPLLAQHLLGFRDALSFSFYVSLIHHVPIIVFFFFCFFKEKKIKFCCCCVRGCGRQCRGAR